MSKEKPLAQKVDDAGHFVHDTSVARTKDVKEHIQRAERDLKDLFANKHIIQDDIEKIFLKRFGRFE